MSIRVKDGLLCLVLIFSSVIGPWVQANPVAPLSKDSARSNNRQEKSEKFKAPYGSHLEPILQKIGATPEQAKKITEIVMAYRPRLEPLRQEYRQKSQEFLTCLVSRKPAEDVMASQGELNQLHSVIVSQYSLMRLEIRRLLTPEQCVLFEEYRCQQGWSTR